MQLTKYLVIQHYDRIRVYWTEDSKLMVMDNVSILPPRESLSLSNTLKSIEVRANKFGRDSMYLDATTPEEAITFYKLLKGS